MAVPKKKISKSRRGNRRAGNGAKKLNLPNVVVDPITGGYKLSHHISIDGYYNGKKVIEEKEVKTEDSNTEESKQIEQKS